MKPARRGVLIATLLLTGACSPRPAEKPELALLSALPILFPEEMTLEGGGSPTLDALERHYRVRPVSTAAELAGHKLLLMAQPQAQTAEALVALDSWVRDGGRVLLLADPALQWPSALPLGDVRRPPFAFSDTGLLGHWGLRLDAPDRLGPAAAVVDGKTIETRAPGTLAATGNECRVESGGLVAHCAIGKGKATIIADADFLDSEAGSQNLEALVAELEQLGE